MDNEGPPWDISTVQVRPSVTEIDKRLDELLWRYIARLRRERIHQDQMDVHKDVDSRHTGIEDE